MQINQGIYRPWFGTGVCLISLKLAKMRLTALNLLLLKQLVNLLLLR